MAAEVDFLRDQVSRLNIALEQHQDTVTSRPLPQSEDQGSESMAPWLLERGIMAPLVTEYERHVHQMEAQLKQYQKQMEELKSSLEQVVLENERLHKEQRVCVEEQLQCVSVGGDGDALTDTVLIHNLEQQLKCALEEKDRVMDMCQATTEELDRVRIHTVERHHLQNQLGQLQQHTHQLQTTNHKLDQTNQQLLKTVSEQSAELEELRGQLRQAKQDLRTATAKVDEMTGLMRNVQDQIQRKEEDAAQAHGREEASDRRLLELQAALSQLEGRLKAAVQEADAVRRERTVWERQLGELHNRCAALEDEKFEALQRLRNALQLVEEAALHRDQGQLREKQKMEELERMKEGMKQLVEEASTRTRREVESVRKQCNSQIHRLTEELSALQLECADKETQIERAQRQRKAVEEELERVYKEGRCGDPEMRKMELLHQRCLNAERQKEETELTLNTTLATMKKAEMSHGEELSQCQEEVRRLQVALSSAREENSSISEERLGLLQDNHKLQRDINTLRKECVLAQREAKQQVWRAQQEVCVREQALQARLNEVEESSRSSSAELNRLLQAQQKTTNRYREETHNLKHTFQKQSAALRSELNRLKQRCQELEIQLESEHSRVMEYEQQLAEQREKNVRLQNRLTLAEHRASSISHQLTVMSKKRKTASLINLETAS